MRLYLPFLLLLLSVPAAAQTSPSPTGPIRGNLVASDGASLAGVTLQYGRLAPRNPKAGPAMLPPVLTHASLCLPTACPSAAAFADCAILNVRAVLGAGEADTRLQQ